MASAFEDPPESAFMLLLIQEEGDGRPSPEKLERVDEIVGRFRGHAWRFGIGAGKSLNTFNYGYLLPKGATVTVDRHKLADLETKLAEAGVRSPWVRVRAAMPDREDIGSMEMVGTPPEDVLSGLQNFADDLDNAIE